ncbi:PLP-dependent aminotransferase family protein [Burkholderia ubonensis]|uniref:aminotransferase-like domain-containing protein n=1 Tax=Burkholderia ubonensis TaxID=101571 RepID=UPI000753BA42|nr:PLP-dependent aminotransferase family protein [Burkholderia ubonensis]KWB44390.1 transcriptional regulator [Burkholderia ubonensis]
MPATEPFLHVSLAATLEAEIARGLWSPGQRLPSVRQLSRTQRVSVTTALAAYRLLEDRRLIEARPQKGFYVQQTGACTLSAPERRALDAERADESLTRDTLNRVDASPDLISFGTALCGKELFPIAALSRCIASTARRHPHLLAEVSFSPGSQRLRTCLAEHASSWNCQFGADDVLVTNGCVEAFGLCLQAVARPGDAIVVDAPAYYGYLSTIERLGMTALPLPFAPDPARTFDEIARLARERRIGACLLSTCVGNPAGTGLSNDMKSALVERLERIGIPLIEDATFSDLHFASGQRAAKSYDRSGNVLLCSSLSKTLSPGLRIGWVSGGRHHDALVTLKRTMSIGQPLLIQEGVAEYLLTGGYRHHLRQLRKQCQRQVEQTAQIVARRFPAGTQCALPNGGYLLWARLPDRVPSMALYQLAFEAGITFAPGPLFAVDDAFAHHVRLNCGEKLDARRRDALIRLGGLACALAERDAGVPSPG